MIAFIIAVVVSISMVLGVVVYYHNRLVTLNSRVLNAWSQIGVQLARRADLVPALVEVLGVSGLGVRAEAISEAESSREAVQAATDTETSLNAQVRLENAISHLVALARTPQGNKNEALSAVLREIREADDKVSYMRHSFNDTVTLYNEALERFPTNIIAEFFGFEPRPLLVSSVSTSA